MQEPSRHNLSRAGARHVSACGHSSNIWRAEISPEDASVEDALVTYEAARQQFASPALAVERAREVLRVERSLGEISDSLFGMIAANEIGPATSMAERMLGDSQTAADAVRAAFKKARSEFSAYDGSASPRSWVLGFVTEEAARRSVEVDRSGGC